MPAILDLFDLAAPTAAAAAPRRWLWDGILAPSAVTLMTSRGKIGKTTLLAHLLARLGTGGTLAGRAVAPAGAFVASEEPPEIWRQRHARLHFPRDLRLACRPFRGLPTMAEWVDLIAELAAEPPGVAVFDPLATLLPAAAENSLRGMLAALEPLRRLTAAGTAVLLLHHPRKARWTDDDRPRGGRTLPEFADILVQLDRPRGADFTDRRRRLKVESRWATLTTTILELSPDERDYAVRPDPPDREGFEFGWPPLKAVLAATRTPLMRKDLRDAWPPDHETPALTTLARWLDRATRDGLIAVSGTGRFRDPFRYELAG